MIGDEVGYRTSFRKKAKEVFGEEFIKKGDA